MDGPAKELVPDDDQSEFSVNLRLPAGTSFARTEEYLADIERNLRQLPEVDLVFANVSAGSANFYVGLKPLEEINLFEDKWFVIYGK